MIAVHRQR